MIMYLSLALAVLSVCVPLQAGDPLKRTRSTSGKLTHAIVVDVWPVEKPSQSILPMQQKTPSPEAHSTPRPLPAMLLNQSDVAPTFLATVSSGGITKKKKLRPST